MPTAARLFAAFAFAAIGFLAAETYKPGLPPETQWGRFSLISTLIGILCGWFIMGRLAGRGMRPALGSGVRTSANMVFYAMLVFSIYEMILRSLRKRYDGVFEAVTGTFDIMLAYGIGLMQPQPLIVLLVGGMLGGLLAEWASRQWR